MLIWFLCFEYQGHFHGTYVLFVAFSTARSGDLRRSNGMHNNQIGQMLVELMNGDTTTAY